MYILCVCYNDNHNQDVYENVSVCKFKKSATFNIHVIISDIEIIVF